VDTTLLQHFVAVAEELHFSRAAKTLGISRQALSKSIKALESELGIEIFDRSVDTTVLTDDGRLAYERAVEQLAAVADEENGAEEIVEPTSSLSIAFVPGVTLGKWTLAWEKRHPDTALRFVPGSEQDSVRVLRDGVADLSFVRLPIEQRGLSVIRLYTETTVIVVPQDHPIAAVESVTLADLADETVIENPELVADSVELAAAGVHLVQVPQSIARLHARKDVVWRPITDAETTDIAIAWNEDEFTVLMDEFVGIVRGRTEASTRTAVATAARAALKSPAKEAKMKAAALRAASGKTKGGAGKSAAGKNSTVGRIAAAKGKAKAPGKAKRRGSR